MKEKLLDAKISTEVKEILTTLKKPVELIVYLAEESSDKAADLPGAQEETITLLAEIAELSPLLSVTEKNISESSEAAPLGIDLGPTILFREEGSDRTNIRYIGIPSGYEFSTLLNGILMVGGADESHSQKILSELSQIKHPTTLKTFVTPTCPYCPQAVLSAFKMALHNPLITAEGIEATEYPVLSGKYKISSVPDTAIEVGESSKRVIGAQPDRIFVEAIQSLQGVSA